MQVSVTTIDPNNPEVEQRVAGSCEELNQMLGIGETLDEMAVRHAEAEKERYFREYLRLADDDLDEPLPPKQCVIDDPECESCQ